MKTVQISLNSIDKVKSFVNAITQFEFDFDLISGRYVIDAKSIMGIFSLDLSKPIDLAIHAESNMDEIMEYQGRLYFMPHKEIKRRTEELLEFCDLIQFRKRTVRKLSGGMKRKLMVCRALLTDPEILLLDEPTAGMDALSRRQMWNLLRKLNGKNLTILLTTHYMEEAQNLCSRVALMDHGKLEEVSTPSALINSLGNYTVDEFSGDETKSHYFHTREEAIAYLSNLSGQASLRETTLEDVFVERAGRHLMPS